MITKQSNLGMMDIFRIYKSSWFWVMQENMVCKCVLKFTGKNNVNGDSTVNSIRSEIF